jgi:hypothetical protein
MDKDARQKKLEKQTNELHSAIGEFIVEFEQVCHAISVCIIFILHKNGLQNQKIAHILLAGLTAEPLQSMLHSLIIEVHKPDKEEKEIIKNIFTRFKKLTEKRNETVHSTWFIGWASEDDIDFSTARGSKYYRSTTNNEIKNIEVKSQYFDELTEEARKLKGLFYRLDGCLQGECLIQNNFTLDSQKNSCIPNAAEES